MSCQSIPKDHERRRQDAGGAAAPTSTRARCGPSTTWSLPPIASPNVLINVRTPDEQQAFHTDGIRQGAGRATGP